MLVFIDMDDNLKKVVSKFKGPPLYKGRMSLSPI